MTCSNILCEIPSFHLKCFVCTLVCACVVFIDLFDCFLSVIEWLKINGFYDHRNKQMKTNTMCNSSFANNRNTTSFDWNVYSFKCHLITSVNFDNHQDLNMGVCLYNVWVKKKNINRSGFAKVSSIPSERNDFSVNVTTLLNVTNRWSYAIEKYCLQNMDTHKNVWYKISLRLHKLSTASHLL